MKILHTCPTCEVVIKLDKASEMDLIVELEERARHGTGGWDGRCARRLKELAERLNPPPINQ